MYYALHAIEVTLRWLLHVVYRVIVASLVGVISYNITYRVLHAIEVTLH